jgi:hypothetical protein
MAVGRGWLGYKELARPEKSSEASTAEKSRAAPDSIGGGGGGRWLARGRVLVAPSPRCSCRDGRRDRCSRICRGGEEAERKERRRGVGGSEGAGIYSRREWGVARRWESLSGRRSE